MSNKIKINSSYIEYFASLIKDKKCSEIKKIITDLHVADIAEIINYIDNKDIEYFYKLITEKEKAAAVVVRLKSYPKKNLLKHLSAKEISKNIIQNLATDDAADIIGELATKKKRTVLSLIKNLKQSDDINDLLRYAENTAGSLMAKELIKVNENWNTIQCLKEMRKQANNIQKVYTIYVVNDKNKLLGLMSLRRLLLTEKSTAIKNIILREIISVKASEYRENVVNLMRKYNLVALPVVDDVGKLIGRITIDDVMDVAKEEAEKDYQMASGISEYIESNKSIWGLTRARLPWLIIGMLGGILGAEVIGIFNLSEHIELAFFIPLIAAMGGNVGVQSAAIVVQGLANKSLKMDNLLQKLVKELAIGILNGVICSIIILATTFGLGYSMNLSITVSISLLTVIIFAALFGTFTPLALKKYNIDPALATGPFITTANDVLGLFIYFFIGKSIL